MSDSASDELLRLAWLGIRAWHPDGVVNIPAARRAIARGATPEDLATAMCAAAYEAVFALLSALDEGGDPNGAPGPTMWSVMNSASRLPLSGLHEELLCADPTGREGEDLFR